jgi:type IV pilus assembly protein PilQ
LPGELTQPSVLLASFGGSTEPARPTPQQAAQQQSGNAAATVANSQATATGRYTGEPISVNLKDVDLKDFFRLIHEISGLNVVLDPAVKGSLTIVLDEVPWDQALDIVLQNNGLDKQLSGNVLRIATRDTMKREAEGQRDLERAQAEAVAPVTVTRVLSYGKAEKMKDTLKKFLSQRGDILSDDRSNQLIIRDIPSVIPVIDNLIRQLDRKSQQVEIEARVVSASRSFAQDIGVQLGFAGTATGGRSVIAGDPVVGTSTTTTSPLPPPFISSGTSTGTPLPLNVNLGAAAPSSGLFLGHRSPNFAVDFFITAAETKGVGKLLSKPRVVTQNNEKAIIKQGQKIPIQTTINNTISVQFIDAVLKLEVTPQITAEGTVFMDVLVENTQIDAGIPRIQGVPALDTQSEETKILVADGGTVVVGGIIVSNQNVTTNEVPLLGSLPLIGHLFKRNNVIISSQELLFFLTPRIIPG